MRKITRRMDAIGRVTIPADMRKMVGLEELEYVEIELVDEGILLKPCAQNAKCMVTGETEDLKVYADNIILSDKGRQMLLKAIMNEMLEEGKVVK